MGLGKRLKQPAQTPCFWLVIILLLGFSLRVYSLGHVSINNDEIYVYNRWINRSFQAILVDDVSLNNHSLAILLDRVSILLLGDTLFTLRWPALWVSMFGIAFIYKLANALFDLRVGLASAALLALSPYAIFFANTFRGYSGVVALPLLVCLLALMALRSNQWRYWLAMGLAAALMIYTHLFTALALANLVFLMGLIWLYRHGLKSLKRLPWVRPGLSLAITALILAGLYMPVFNKLFGVTAGTTPTTQSSAFSIARPQVPASLWTNLVWFNGLEEGSFGSYGAVCLLALVILGTGWGIARGNGLWVIMLLSWVLLPFLELWLVKQGWQNFWARPQYLGYILPALLMLAALAIVSLAGRFLQKPIWATVTVIPVLLLGLFWFLTIEEFYRVYTNGNWQAIGNFLQQNSTGADLVVCQRYHHGWREVHIDAEDDCTRTLDYRRHAGVAMASPVFISHDLVYRVLPTANSGIINRMGRVWVVVWDVPDDIEFQPSGGLKVTEFHQFGRSLVILAGRHKTYAANLADALAMIRSTSPNPDQQYIYSLMIAPLAAASGQLEAARSALEMAAKNQPDHPESLLKLEATWQLAESLSPATIEHLVEANFSGQIMLQGYNISQTAVAPGAKIDLTLFWRALKRIPKDYTIFLHLRDQAGETVAQFDYEPFSGSYPTRNWQPGQLLTGPREFTLPAKFPAGKYNLVIGLYDRQSLERLPLVDDQSGENALFLTDLLVK